MAARKKSTRKAKKSTSKASKKRSGVRTKSKRTASKKTTAKSKSTTVAIETGPIGRVGKGFTKSVLLAKISDRTGVSKKDVSAVISQLGEVIEAHIRRGGPGKFTMPGMFKMTVKNVPAKKARKGINPFTGEPTTFKAKPASRKVRILALKSLKEMAQ